MQESNRFTVRVNRFVNPQNIEKVFTCVQMKKYLKSINLSDEYFTNYSKSMASNKYRLVKEVWEKCKNKSNVTDSCMLADEMINEKNKIDRLKKIIMENINKEITNQEIINNVYKFKHKEDKEVQFYFYHDGKILNLILVDIFHLGIPALKNGKEVYKNKYLTNRKNKCCLSNIIK